MAAYHRFTLGLVPLMLAACASVPASTQAQLPAAGAVDPMSTGTSSGRGIDSFGSGKPLSRDKQVARIASAVEAQYPLGSAQNPVRASMPAGQRAYLARLRCPNGEAPRYRRAGNLGRGPYGTIVDLFLVRCGSSTQAVVIDMYHNWIENRPVPGFSIVPATPST